MGHKAFIKHHSQQMKSLLLERKPAVDACRDHPTDPCEYLEKDSDYCSAYAFPETRWRLGKCPLATHLEIESKKKEKVRVGQQKQRRIR
jgi:hypothetical protein